MSASGTEVPAAKLDVNGPLSCAGDFRCAGIRILGSISLSSDGTGQLSDPTFQTGSGFITSVVRITDTEIQVDYNQSIGAELIFAFSRKCSRKYLHF